MTPEQGLQWFTDEIAKSKAYIANKEFGDDVRTHQYGRLNGLWDAKNHFARFIALQEPSQPTEEKEFTEGL